jgi:(p)ppGpp synthase/HD superfamily hydrolase
MWVDRFNEALEFAVRHHTEAGCFYGDLPYLHHLMDVCEQLRDMGLHPGLKKPKVSKQQATTLLVACVLHDVVEDTAVTLDEVREKFGDDVADIVFAVTNEPGKNRKERFAKTYPKIAANQSAIWIKLCDRMANVMRCWRSGDSRMKMYQKEYEGMWSALYSKEDKIAQPFWDELDSLLLYQYHPRKFYKDAKG